MLNAPTAEDAFAITKKLGAAKELAERLVNDFDNDHAMRVINKINQLLALETQSVA